MVFKTKDHKRMWSVKDLNTQCRQTSKELKGDTKYDRLLRYSLLYHPHPKMRPKKSSIKAYLDLMLGWGGIQGDIFKVFESKICRNCLWQRCVCFSTRRTHTKQPKQRRTCLEAAHGPPSIAKAGLGYLRLPR